MDSNLPNPNNRTRVSAVEAVALALIIIIIFMFFVRPQVAVLGEQKSSLAQAREDYKTVQQDKDNLNLLIDRVTKSKADMELLDEAVPLADRPTRVEVLLDSLVKSANMQTVELNVPAPESVVAGNKQVLANPYAKDRKLETTDVDMRVKGDMDQFKNLLRLIETNGRIVDITSIDMAKDDTSTLFKLKLKTYSYVP